MISSSNRIGRAWMRATFVLPFLFVPLVAACDDESPTQPVSTPIVAESAGDEGRSSGNAGDADGSEAAAPAAAPTSAAIAEATARIAALLPAFEGVFGSPGSQDGELMLPFDVAVAPDGDLYVSDSTGVQRFTPDGTFRQRIGEDEILTALGGLAVAPNGTVYVTGFESQVLVYGPDGARREPIGTAGTEPGQLQKPVDVALDASGNLYVADSLSSRVEKYAPDGRHLLTIGEPGTQRGQLSSPRAVAVDADGNVYVGLGDHFLIQRFDPTGTYIDAFGQGHADENVWRVGGLAITASGDVLVSQVMSNQLQSFDAKQDLTLAWEMGELGASAEAFSSPMGLAIDGDRLYITDQQNNRVKTYRLGATDTAP